LLVPELFLVRQARGPAWDPSLGRREQAGWEAHAAFVDQLSKEGKVLLGGPVGDANGRDVVLVVVAESEEEADSIFGQDPWRDSVLKTESVERWRIWIGADALPHSRPSSNQGGEANAEDP
jgi:uncharacterized protein YciI